MEKFVVRLSSPKKLINRMVIGIGISLFLVPISSMILPLFLSGAGLICCYILVILSIPILLYLLVHSAYSLEKISVTSVYLRTESLGDIAWEQVRFARLQTKKRLLIQLNTSIECTFVPEKQFSPDAIESFQQFFNTFKSALEASKKDQ
jgi:hypothetical protein